MIGEISNDMLIDTMTPQELTMEISKNYGNIQNSLDRLAQGYDRERRRGKISKYDRYCRAYEIKTKKKNNWVIFMDKGPSDEKYKSLDSIAVGSHVYYYTPLGLRVFKIMLPTGLSVFNAHLFTRYNERMNLGLTIPLEIVKHFFTNNGYYIARIIAKDNREFIFTTCSEGILLGELQEGRRWIVYNTFLTRDLIRPDQTETEAELISNLQSEIEAELTRKDFDKTTYKADILKGIKQCQW
jgi:hypothetical protein